MRKVSEKQRQQSFVNKNCFTRNLFQNTKKCMKNNCCLLWSSATRCNKHNIYNYAKLNWFTRSKYKVAKQFGFLIVYLQASHQARKNPKVFIKVRPEPGLIYNSAVFTTSFLGYKNLVKHNCVIHLQLWKMIF